MFTARVIGEVVATIKHRDLSGRKLLLVQPVDAAGAAAGAAQIAVDVVDAGLHDLVLVNDEGNGAAQLLGQPRGAVRTVIVGVVDAITREPQAGA